MSESSDVLQDLKNVVNITGMSVSYTHLDVYKRQGYDVAVVDCDYPQHSIAGMRKRDAEQVEADEDYKRMAYEQFTRLG